MDILRSTRREAIVTEHPIGELHAGLTQHISLRLTSIQDEVARLQVLYAGRRFPVRVTRAGDAPTLGQITAAGAVRIARRHALTTQAGAWDILQLTNRSIITVDLLTDVVEADIGVTGGYAQPETVSVAQALYALALQAIPGAALLQLAGGLLIHVRERVPLDTDVIFIADRPDAAVARRAVRVLGALKAHPL
jgi:hypothetical protein